MGGARGDEPVRRRAVPEPARRSLWLYAAWTGVGAAVVCATVAIVVVAIVWLPVSGTTGRTNSSIRAGLLTFLAALHGGITVDGVHAHWLPLGMLLLVAVVAWRAGAGLADAADGLGERDPARLALAAAAQALSFAIACLAAVPFATLGTSGAPFAGVGLAALLLFAVSGGTAFVRAGPLAAWCAGRAPAGSPAVLRGAAAALTVYLGFGAVLVAGSVIVHHDRVEALSRQVGGGWGGVPILLLGVLAAPNAVIAATAYLAGPGFALGAGTSVSALGTAHGTLPAFPLLGAVPSGPGAPPLVWALMSVAAVAAGVPVARLALRAASWPQRFARLGASAAIAGVAMAVLAWQGGGAVADGRLHAVGASPWQAGLAVAGAVAVTALAGLGASAAWTAVRSGPARTAATDEDEDGDPWQRLRLIGRAAGARPVGNHDAREPDDLAG